MAHKRTWLLRGAIGLAVFAALDGGVSLAVRTNAARQYFTKHLETNFGRRVEVSRYDFSLLSGLGFEADSVTVSEDPRFGDEYFLRADRLSVSPRWSALFSGRFEFGTLKLSGVSLNLVRDSSGHWNVEGWLPPRPSTAQNPTPVGSAMEPEGQPSAARLYRIEVEDGRINFKQNHDKVPFGLVGVAGYVRQGDQGRWDIDLEATPTRAGIELQESGTVRLRGTVAGTSSRLQPAQLNITWRDGSLADALRLGRRFDYGVRGRLEADIIASVLSPEGADPARSGSGLGQWSISGALRILGAHGWRLAGRASDPSVNLSFLAEWRTGEPRIELERWVLEMAKTHIEGSGEADWTRDFRPRFHIRSSSFGLSDVLAWYRAFRPGVAPDLGIEGTLGIDATLSGWPPRLEQGAIASGGGQVTLASLPAPLEFGPINASVRNGGLDFAGTNLGFSSHDELSAAGSKAGPQSADSFQIRGTIFPGESGNSPWRFRWAMSIEGKTPRAQDWLALSDAVAQPLARDWHLEGGLGIKLRGVHSNAPLGATWTGRMDLRDAAVGNIALNQPLHIPEMHVAYAGSARTVKFGALEGFGTVWKGSISRAPNDARWSFDLNAERLDVAEIDRWLGPRARPGILERIATLAESSTEIEMQNSALRTISAHGRLRSAELVVSPLRIEDFDAEVRLNGQDLAVRGGKANFYAGKISGEFDAHLVEDPVFRFKGTLDRVNLVPLANAVPRLRGRIRGTASSRVEIRTHGIGSANLIRALEGEGTLEVRNGEMQGFPIPTDAAGSPNAAPSGHFTSARGKWSMNDGQILFDSLLLDTPDGRFETNGKVGFSRSLDLAIRRIGSLGSAPTAFHMTGTLEAPILAVIPSADPPTQPALQPSRAVH